MFSTLRHSSNTDLKKEKEKMRKENPKVSRPLRTSILLENDVEI